MLKNNLLIIILTIVALIIVIAYLIIRNEFSSRPHYLYLIYAALFVIVAGIIGYFYRKYTYKSKHSEKTIIYKPRKLLAKLVLPDKKEFKINEYERTFGREDFVGSLVDNLLFLGKQHFKVSLLDDGFYIQDLNTKNGTLVNGEEIKGMGKIKLKDQDEIIVAGVLKIKYLEQR